MDTLKLNLGVPAAETSDRFSVLAGDTAGFPNGRRLTDDVVDIELQVVAGFLKGNKVPLGDGVDQNDKAFSDTFRTWRHRRPGSSPIPRTAWSRCTSR